MPNDIDMGKLWVPGLETQTDSANYAWVRREIEAGRILYEKFKKDGIWPDTPKDLLGWIGIRNTFPADTFFLTQDELKIQENWENTHNGDGRLAPELVKTEVIFRTHPKYPNTNPADELIATLNEMYPKEAEKAALDGVSSSGDLFYWCAVGAGVILLKALKFLPQTRLWGLVVSIGQAAALTWSAYWTKEWVTKTADGKNFYESVKEVAKEAEDILKKTASGVLDIAKMALIGFGLYIIYNIVTKK